MNTDATRAHIDAETMAAWADRALPAEAAASVELHLSNCDRCQEVLAAFVRSAPVTGAVVIPFWARRPVQWSAAGLAAAAALVAMVWIGRPPAPPAPESTVASRSVAESTAASAPVNRLQDQTTVTPSASAPAELRRDRPAAAAAEMKKEKPSSLSAREERRRDQPARTLDDKAAANKALAKKTEGRAAAAAAPPPVAQAVAAPPPPPAATMPPPPPPPPPVTVGGVASVVTPTPIVTPLGAARPAAMSEAFATDAITAIPIIEIFAPETVPSALRSVAGGAGRGGAGARALSQNVAPARWRIVAGTRVERSLDAGATWTLLPIEPALTTPLRAGVATSQSNCWLVGRGGVVLVTSDGLTFRRVSLPESVQLISVIATDALRATVTAIDGRTFSTVDGGLNWK